MCALCRCTVSTAEAQGYENPHTNLDPNSDLDRDVEADSSGPGMHFWGINIMLSFWDYHFEFF